MSGRGERINDRVPEDFNGVDVFEEAEQLPVSDISAEFGNAGRGSGEIGLVSEFSKTGPVTPRSEVLDRGVLSNGDKYTIEILNDSHINDFLDTHERVRAALPAGDKGFLLPKERKTLERHLEKGDGNILLGIRSRGVQIAQGIIVHPKTGDDYSIMRPHKPVAHPEDISFIQAAAVHPEYRGENLLLKLLDAWRDHALAHERPIALAEVKAKNTKSLHLFLKAGLHIASLTKDPIRDDDVYNTTRDFRYEPTAKLVNEVQSFGVPLDDLADQQSSLDQGHQGLAVDHANGLLIMGSLAASAPKRRLGLT